MRSLGNELPVVSADIGSLVAARFVALSALRPVFWSRVTFASPLLTRIPCDFHVAPVLPNRHIGKLNRVGYELGSSARNCGRCFITADDQRRNKESNFVDESGIEQETSQHGAAFNQHTL